MSEQQPDWEKRAAARALLDWYLDAGVDEGVSASPTDYALEPQRPRKSAGRPVARAPSLFEAPAPRDALRSAPTSSLPKREALASDAQTAAQACNTLDELKSAIEAYDGSDLKKTARNIVFDSGNPEARIMMIGQGPGAEEDQKGEVFAGRSGHLLDRMLAAIDLGRNDVYLTNLIPYRVPGNRPPTEQEAALFRPFLNRQIELAAPEILVLLGGPAAKEIGKVSQGITKARGRWVEVGSGDRKLPTLVTLHPAYLLRTPIAKRAAWRDILALRQKFDTL